jgi:hypothetical protein
MDLGDWLRSLGLERYEAAFRENEINEKVLPSLTAEDLKELGVNALGHRRTLLAAIAALHADAKAPPLDALPTIDTSAKDTAERRQVTVIFSDWSARRRSPPAWTRRTCARSFPLTRSVSPRPCSGSVGSWRSTWATASSSISDTRKRTRTMPSEQYGRGWN